MSTLMQKNLSISHNLLCVLALINSSILRSKKNALDFYMNLLPEMNKFLAQASKHKSQDLPETNSYKNLYKLSLVNIQFQESQSFSEEELKHLSR